MSERKLASEFQHYFMFSGSTTITALDQFRGIVKVRDRSISRLLLGIEKNGILHFPRDDIKYSQVRSILTRKVIWRVLKGVFLSGMAMSSSVLHDLRRNLFSSKRRGLGEFLDHKFSGEARRIKA